MAAHAFIPVRGGSKGIPRKNLQPLGGLPLFVHTVLQAKQARSVARVICSTEDDEIAAVARRYGAEVSLRPDDLASDVASTDAVVLDHLERDPGLADDDLIVLLQATSPFRRAADIDAAVSEFRRAGADSLLTVAPSHRFRWTRDGAHARSEDYVPEHRPRRQDLPDRYIENGSIYVTRAIDFRTRGSRLPGLVGMHVMDEASALEIDSFWDLEAARALWPRYAAATGHADLAGLAHLFLDCDGVLTDNGVLVDGNGMESVGFHRGDGHGLAAVRAAGIGVTVISRERSKALERRCEKLGIRCGIGILAKDEAIRAVAAELAFPLDKAAFVGNDTPDIPALLAVGHPIAVADAHPSVIAHARYVTTLPGGRGAVREVCDWITGGP